jgi:hypothetical protein
MDMGLAGPLKDPGKEVVVIPKGFMADRTDPAAAFFRFPLQAKRAAHDVHEPVRAVDGGIDRGLYKYPRGKPGGADRTSLGVPGLAFNPRPLRLSPSPASWGYAEKQGITKGQQDRSQYQKDQNLQKSHNTPSPERTDRQINR